MNCERLLYWIRHGATAANLRQPYVLQGQRVDLPLSDQGRRQAEATRRALEDRAIQRVYTSPMRRAAETAEILAASRNLPVQIVPALTECDVGHWEGLSWDDVRNRDPNYLDAFEADPSNVPYEGGESFQAVQDRVVPAVQQLLNDSATGDLAVVTHNIVTRVFVAHVSGIPIAKARSIRQDNGGITIFAISLAQLRLITLNSILHLDGLPSDLPHAQK